ncbi:MAG TPA: hypothetical protein VFZ79_18505 [Acidimicrobiales bacterium]
MCAWTRYVLVAGVAGVLTNGLTGSELAGWIAAAVAVMATLAAERALPGRFGAASCPVPGDSPPPAADAVDGGDGTQVDQGRDRLGQRPGRH